MKNSYKNVICGFVLGLGLLVASQASAYAPGCSIGQDNSKTLLSGSFPSIVRTQAPAAITKSGVISANCTSAANLHWGYYQWTMRIRSATFTKVAGVATQSALDSVGRSLNITNKSLTVAPSGWPWHSATFSDNTDVSVGLSGLQALPSGQYKLTYAVDVQREMCSWGLFLWLIPEFRCSSDGNKQTLTVSYTLDVSEPPKPLCAGVWGEGQAFRLGQLVTYGGKNYRNLQPHTAYVGTQWTPPSTPALWAYVSDCVAEPVLPVQPTVPPVLPVPPIPVPVVTSGVSAQPVTVRGGIRKVRCESCLDWRLNN